VQPTRYISVDALQSVGLFDNVVAYLDGLGWMEFMHKQELVYPALVWNLFPHFLLL